MKNAAARSRVIDYCKHILNSDETARILIVSDRGHALIEAIADGRDRISQVRSPDELPGIVGSERFALAIVTAEEPPATASHALTQLLAALRDRYAQRVLALDEAETMVLTDYLALGFERLPDADLSGLYLFDPDAASRQREWNNARDWANPENFDRFRW